MKAYGIKTLRTASILISLFATSSCSKGHDSYIVRIQNNYFEYLYDLYIGQTQFADTLQVNQAKEIAVMQGQYTFSTKTASGLFLQTGLQIKGNKKNIYLNINKSGKLLKE